MTPCLATVFIRSAPCWSTTTTKKQSSKSQTCRLIRERYGDNTNERRRMYRGPKNYTSQYCSNFGPEFDGRPGRVLPRRRAARSLVLDQDVHGCYLRGGHLCLQHKSTGNEQRNQQQTNPKKKKIKTLPETVPRPTIPASSFAECVNYMQFRQMFVLQSSACVH